MNPPPDTGLSFRSGLAQWDPAYWEADRLQEVLSLWLRGYRLGGALTEQSEPPPWRNPAPLGSFQVFRFGGMRSELVSALSDWSRSLPPASSGKRVATLFPAGWRLLIDSSPEKHEFSSEVFHLWEDFKVDRLRNLARGTPRSAVYLLTVGGPEVFQRLSEFSLASEFRATPWANWHVLALRPDPVNQHGAPGSLWWAEPGVAPAWETP